MNMNNNDFKKIFDKAYAVVIDGALYDVYCDYENEDGTLCTAFVDQCCGCSDVAYVIKPEWENGEIEYHPNYKEFTFKGVDEIPPFKILMVAEPECATRAFTAMSDDSVFCP